MNLQAKNLIDYFVVCGLDVSGSGLEPEPNEIYHSEGVSKPPLERAYKSKILNHFPENLPWNPFDEDAVTQLCLPKGLVFEKHYQKPSFHPFIITREDGSRVYGGAFTFYELVEEDSIRNAMQTLQTMFDAEHSSSARQQPCSPASSQQQQQHQQQHTRSLSASVSSRSEQCGPSSDRLSYATSITPTHVTKPTLSTSSTKRTFRKFSDFQNQSMLLRNSLLSESETSQSLSLTASESPVSHNQRTHQRTQLHQSPAPEYHELTGLSGSPSASTAPNHYSMGRDQLYAPKCICLISQSALYRAFERILSTLYDMVAQTDLLGLSLEAHLHNLLYSLPMPSPGSALKFSVGCRATHVHVPACEPARAELPLLELDLGFGFFSLLSVPDIVAFYTAALLEHQILLYSKSYSTLMLVAESLTALFFPFTWLKPYVPIVPASNLHFIEAPVPYIMGFHHANVDKEMLRAGQRCFVDIDSGSVSCPEGLPDLPDKAAFCQALASTLHVFREKRQSLLRAARSHGQAPLSLHRSLGHNQRQQSGNEPKVEQALSGLGSLRLEEANSAYASGSADARPSSATGTSSDCSDSDILRNSQAYMRISELARKAGVGANDSSPGYEPETLNASCLSGLAGLQAKSTKRDSSSSGVSSVSSMVNANDTCASHCGPAGHQAALDKSDNNPHNNSHSFASEATSSFAHDTSATDSPIANSNANANANAIAKVHVDEEELLREQLTCCVRELFLAQFVSLFACYEKYVIVPNLEQTSVESWWTCREYGGNFDSKMFLMEQPSPRLPFLSHFTSTQMFASFIDLKVISLIEQHKPPEPNVHIFDARIAQFRAQHADAASGSAVMCELKAHAAAQSTYSLDIKGIEAKVAARLGQVPREAPLARRLTPAEPPTQDATQRRAKYLFENIDTKLLKADEDFIKKVYKEMKVEREAQAKKREQFENNPQLKARKVRVRRRSKKPSSVLEGATNQQGEAKPGQEDRLNPVFIQSLLKESKLKTKRLLVEKMPEAVHLGHGECRISGVEENMLIASLCDLIERIWAHGLHSKPGKSALWNHLSNYRKLIQYLKPSHALDSRTTSPRYSSMPRKRPTLSVAPADKSLQTPSPKSRHMGSASNLNNLLQSQWSGHKRAHSVNNSGGVGAGYETGQPAFGPLVSDLLNDLACVDKLSEVKTEIGKARAFVRLSLEKKLLAEHLRRLLDEAELLRALYRKHAFLRQEDEREQFMYHLESLNVVDHFCFTHHFKSIATDYSVLLLPSAKRPGAASTSANGHLKLFGSLGESEIVPVPRNTLHFQVACRSNLGPLSTLSLGHDNAGLTPRWLLDCLLVRNDITGHVHKFPCGRWLGRGVDDDSLERLLVSAPLSARELHELGQPSSPGLADRSRSPLAPSSASSAGSSSERPRLPVATIQETLGNSVNALLKFFERPDAERHLLTPLLCGRDESLVTALEHVFLFGFRSYKLFSKKLFVWDMLERAAQEFDGPSVASFLLSPQPVAAQPPKAVKSTDRFTNAVREINLKSANYGKDGKFQIFVCLACRNSLLSDWFSLLSRSSTVAQMYDEFSFLRDYELNKFCMKILCITNQFTFKLEKSLTMGIQPVAH